MKRMKKTLALLLALAMSFSLTAISIFAEGKLTVAVGTVTGTTGNTVQLPVTVSNHPGIVSAKLAFSFDSKALELTGMTKGEAFADAMLEANLEDGIAVLDNSTADAAVSGDVTLLTLTFQIKKDAAVGTYAVSVEAKQVVGGEPVDNITAAVQAGSVTVTEAAADLPSVEDVDTSKKPETLPEENISFAKDAEGKTIMTIDPVSISGGETVTAPACVVLIKNGESYTKVNATANGDGTYSFDVSELGEGQIVVATKGDANGDGIVDVTDYTTIARSLLQSSNGRYQALEGCDAMAADADGNGAVDVTDYTTIARSLLQNTNNRYAAITW